MADVLPTAAPGGVAHGRVAPGRVAPVVVVTGASQGIGEAAILAFAEGVPGARLALVSRNAARMEAVAARAREHGAEAEVFPCDVTQDEAVAETARAILARFGPPAVLVVNAGAFEPGMIETTTAEAFRRQLDANLTSAFLTTQAFLPAMRAARTGHLFYMGSVASVRAYPGGVAYCAAKHGLLGLARVVREETKADGLRVTTLLPGATRTPSWDGTPEPDERFMPPEDIARALLDVWRLSDRTVIEEMLMRPQLGDL